MTSVLIVGAGPTGLTLACDLARSGVAVRIIEKSPRFPRSSRAKGPNPRTLEVLEDLGVLEEVLDSGAPPPVMLTYRDGRPVAHTDPFAGYMPTPDAPYDRAWMIPQWRLEEILRERLASYGVEVELGAELADLEQRETGVTAVLADGRRIGARYAVGCDGGHSTVRNLLGLPFEGSTTGLVMVHGDVEAEGPDRAYWHQWFGEDGVLMMCPIPGTCAGWWFQSTPERDADGALVEPSKEGFRRLVDRYAGRSGVRLADATLLSTYRVNVRMVDRYRVGSVLLAGDAAHVHSVAGGMGMNTGVQDAHNLGWKLALVVAGRAGEDLLDTYQEERLPVAAWTLDVTSERLRAALEAVKQPNGGLDVVVTEDTTGLGVGYRWSSLAREPEGGDGRAGRLRAGDRAPDAPCHDVATGTPKRLFEVFAGPHFTLLGFGAGTGPALREVAASTSSDLVRTCPVDAGAEGLSDEKGYAMTAYGAARDLLVLVRPDNHVGLVTGPGDVRSVLDCLEFRPG